MLLEAKAAKGIHQVCIEKAPDRHVFIHSTGCMSILRRFCKML